MSEHSAVDLEGLVHSQVLHHGVNLLENEHRRRTAARQHHEQAPEHDLEGRAEPALATIARLGEHRTGYRFDII